MEVNARFVGCRIQCYHDNDPKKGFSIPCEGFANPTREETAFWHETGWWIFKRRIPVRIVDRPLSKNTDDVVAWLKTLDGKTLEIMEPVKEKENPIPYYGDVEYEGEIYPEAPGMKDYRDRVEIVKTV
jgi:hypothetical protein